MKAKRTYDDIYGKYYNEIEYEYRGHKYTVEYPRSSWSGITTAPRIQHEDAQARIDEEIERESHKRPFRYEDSAEYGFDLFFNYCMKGGE